MIGLLVGGVLVVVGAWCLWHRGTLQKQLRLMAVDTSRAADVAGMAPGTLVEVKGMLRCDAPLTSEFARRLCAWYANTIEERIEDWERRSDGKRHRTTRYRTVQSNVDHAPFLVEDESGTVRVDAEGAEIEAAQVVDRYEPREQGIGGIAMSLIGADTVEGHRYRERILAPDIPIYVLGCVQSDGSIGAPPPGASDRIFRVSHLSEEEQTKSAQSSIAWLLWLGVGAIAVGCVAAVWGLL